MQIANPIYDVVFKYLLEDNDIARLLISTILGREIAELFPFPQERTIAFEWGRSLTVYRMDYSARIRKPDGEFEQIIIEIQKAKFPTDVMRFRRYLGNQYQRKENTITVRIRGRDVEKPIPIIPIYFLGYRLEHMHAPAIQVLRQYRDISTNEIFPGREEFIDGVTHDAFVIQLPCLRQKHKSEVDDLLSLFDQRRTTRDNEHILDVDEEQYPEKYRALIRRLYRACSDKKIQDIMDAEDGLIKDFENLERGIEHRDEIIEEQAVALEEQGKALEEKDKTLEEKDKNLEQKDKTLAEKNRTLQEKDKTIQELQKQLQQLKTKA
uniref:PD-(D/E)XK nuclease family transposase n=1 Tax=Candidatus Kentrum sp. MB TaxID=2138164 RepID=A0A450X4J7_9GAMM|nr:MAG: hypothetical protein BECKMB1821G_GA0114241_100773 [Candidatus Kentron sp. MB]